eukprot:gene28286-26636_t
MPPKKRKRKQPPTRRGKSCGVKRKAQPKAKAGGKRTKKRSKFPTFPAGKRGTISDAELEKLNEKAAKAAAE